MPQAEGYPEGTIGFVRCRVLRDHRIDPEPPPFVVSAGRIFNDPATPAPQNTLAIETLPRGGKPDEASMVHFVSVSHFVSADEARAALGGRQR